MTMVNYFSSQNIRDNKNYMFIWNLFVQDTANQNKLFCFSFLNRIENISDFEVTDWQLARQLDAVAALQTVSMRLGYFYWDLNLSLIVIVATTGGLPVHVGHVDASVLGDHQAHQVNAFSSHYLSIWTSLKYGLILSVMFVWCSVVKSGAKALARIIYQVSLTVCWNYC